MIIGMNFPRSSIFLTLLVPLVTSTCNNDCLLERHQEEAKDQRNFDCRMCRDFELDDSNCPAKGFDCDESFKLIATALSPKDPCACLQMKCADQDAVLMVDGVQAQKVRCSNQTWNTLAGGAAESGVCARPCADCKVLPNLGHENDPLLEAFVPKPAAGTDPCSWGMCENGVLASSDSITVPVQYLDAPLPVFSCAGDGMWKTIVGGVFNGVKYSRLQCIKNKPACDALPSIRGDFCTNKRCADPALVDVTGDPNVQKTLTCSPKERSLRLTSTPKLIAHLDCYQGQWTNDGVNVDSTATVVCIDCPTFTLSPNSVAGTVPTEESEGIICPNGKKLFVEFFMQNSWSTGYPVNTIFCDGLFQWDSSGGVVSEFNSLKEATANNIEWRVACKD